MAIIFDGTKLGQLLSRVTLWVKNFAEITVCSTVFEIQVFLCFAFLKKSWKFKMAAISLAGQNLFLKIGSPTQQLVCGSKNLSKSLYLARFSRYKNFCVLHFWKKNRKFKMAAFLGSEKFYKNLERLVFTEPVWIYVALFLRYKHFLCIAIFVINSNIHFWWVKYLLKLGMASLHRYPAGQKFCRNPTSKFLFYEENGFKKYSYHFVLFYMCTLWAYISKFFFF